MCVCVDLCRSRLDVTSAKGIIIYLFCIQATIFESLLKLHKNISPKINFIVSYLLRFFISYQMLNVIKHIAFSLSRSQKRTTIMTSFKVKHSFERKKKSWKRRTAIEESREEEWKWMSGIEFLFLMVFIYLACSLACT